MDKLLFDTFDKFNEQDLTIVITHIARRILILRSSNPDAHFWYTILMRINRWLSTEPDVNSQEKEYLKTFHDGRMKAIRSMRERSGMQLVTCKTIVDAWIGDNIKIVHDNIKEHYLADQKHMNMNNSSYVS